MSKQTRDWVSGYADGVQRGIGCALGNLDMLRGRLAAMQKSVDAIDQSILQAEAAEESRLEAETESYRVDRSEHLEAP